MKYSKHLLYVANSSFDELPVDVRKALEREADIFTAELLAPIPVLYFAGCKAASDIKLMCGISNEASEIALTCLQKWSPKNTTSEKALIRHFSDFIFQQPMNLFDIKFKSNNKHILLNWLTAFNE